MRVRVRVTRRVFRLSGRRLLFAVGLPLAGCRSHPSLAPAPVPELSAAACPAPADGGTHWVRAADSAGVTLALPPGFQERAPEGAARHWEIPGDFSQWMTFGIIRGPLGPEAYRRAYQPSLMPEYSECWDEVDGQRVSIQAWRTPNGVFRDYQRLDRYDVFAIWEVRPGVYAYLSGGTYRRSMQVVMLSAVRAWRHSDRPRTPPR
jgi:hypothetical protein